MLFSHQLGELFEIGIPFLLECFNVVVGELGFCSLLSRLDFCHVGCDFLEVCLHFVAHILNKLFSMSSHFCKTLVEVFLHLVYGLIELGNLIALQLELLCDVGFVRVQLRLHAINCRFLTFEICSHKCDFFCIGLSHFERLIGDLCNILYFIFQRCKLFDHLVFHGLLLLDHFRELSLHRIVLGLHSCICFIYLAFKLYEFVTQFFLDTLAHCFKVSSLLLH